MTWLLILYGFIQQLPSQTYKMYGFANLGCNLAIRHAISFDIFNRIWAVRKRWQNLSKLKLHHNFFWCGIDQPSRKKKKPKRENKSVAWLISLVSEFSVKPSPQNLFPTSSTADLASILLLTVNVLTQPATKTAKIMGSNPKATKKS